MSAENIHTLALQILPSPSSNDHEVRILVDGEDWLGNDYLGLDPPHFFSQSSIAGAGRLLVGRCGCGCEGCDDVWVEVTEVENEVIWSNPKGLSLRFEKADYQRIISSAQTDFSWEDVKRTAERLVSEVFAGVTTDDGYSFDWASTRIGVGIITLSFTNNGAQKLVEFGWDERSIKNAVQTAKRLRREIERSNFE